MSSILISSFFDSGGQLLTSLITDKGDGNIKDLIEFLREQNRDRYNRNEKLNINQLRKFYDTFLKVYNINSGENDRKIHIIMLKANAE